MTGLTIETVRWYECQRCVEYGWRDCSCYTTFRNKESSDEIQNQHIFNHKKSQEQRAEPENPYSSVSDYFKEIEEKLSICGESYKSKILFTTFVKSTQFRRSTRLKPCRVHKNDNPECIVNFSECFKRKQKDKILKFKSSSRWLHENIFPIMYSVSKRNENLNTRKGKVPSPLSLLYKNNVDESDDAMKKIIASYMPNEKNLLDIRCGLNQGYYYYHRKFPRASVGVYNIINEETNVIWNNDRENQVFNKHRIIQQNSYSLLENGEFYSQKVYVVEREGIIGLAKVIPPKMLG